MLLIFLFQASIGQLEVRGTLTAVIYDVYAIFKTPCFYTFFRFYMDMSTSLLCHIQDLFCAST